MNTLRNTLTRCRQTVIRLHEDDRGAEGLEKLLIIAAIVIPLLGILIWARTSIRNWAYEEWDNVVSEEGASAAGDR